MPAAAQAEGSGHGDPAGGIGVGEQAHAPMVEPEGGREPCVHPAENYVHPLYYLRGKAYTVGVESFPIDPEADDVPP
ncbi:hypothetical protein GCM10023171_06230 [Microbacterium panaciterrae]|uniref:Uncharacterized protein n=1 Tax=Microbacterium panaciterrae TaxID=985759 RepID=A0ABP8P485_9MICO